MVDIRPLYTRLRRYAGYPSVETLSPIAAPETAVQWVGAALQLGALVIGALFIAGLSGSQWLGLGAGVPLVAAAGGLGGALRAAERPRWIPFAAVVGALCVAGPTIGLEFFRDMAGFGRGVAAGMGTGLVPGLALSAVGLHVATGYRDWLVELLVQIRTIGGDGLRFAAQEQGYVDRAIAEGFLELEHGAAVATESCVALAADKALIASASEPAPRPRLPGARLHAKE